MCSYGGLKNADVHVRRSYSGMSVDGSMPVDPREDNYDSSESDSEGKVEKEASVLAHKHVCYM